jgi:hypothetical protein
MSRRLDYCIITSIIFHQTELGTGTCAATGYSISNNLLCTIYGRSVITDGVSNYEKCVVPSSILRQCVAILLLGSVPLLVYPHKIRYQKAKPNMSGQTPRHTFTVPPEAPYENCGIKVDQAVIDALRGQIPVSQQDSMRWVDDFD